MKKSFWTLLLLAIFILVVSVSLTGCGKKEQIKKEEIIGTWNADDSYGAGKTITFLEDGTYTSKSLIGDGEYVVKPKENKVYVWSNDYGSNEFYATFKDGFIELTFLQPYIDIPFYKGDTTTETQSETKFEWDELEAVADFDTLLLMYAHAESILTYKKWEMDNGSEIAFKATEKGVIGSVFSRKEETFTFQKVTTDEENTKYDMFLIDSNGKQVRFEISFIFATDNVQVIGYELELQAEDGTILHGRYEGEAPSVQP